jgi:hypothetical protein
MIKLFNNLSRTFASGLTGIDDLSRVDANPLLALLGLYFPTTMPIYLTIGPGCIRVGWLPLYRVA